METHDKRFVNISVMLKDYGEKRLSYKYSIWNLYDDFFFYSKIKLLCLMSTVLSLEQLI